ncbi:hypothetical protein ACOMHN_057564 [Nucella lapillus]
MVSCARIVMARHRFFTRVLALGVVLVIGVGFYFVFGLMPEMKIKADHAIIGNTPFGERSSRSRSKFRERSKGKRSLDVERVAEYCNIPSEVVDGEEGEAPDNFSLLSAYVVIRHGDRTPITSFLHIPPPSPPLGCTMDATADFLQTVPELRSFLRHMAEQKTRQRSHGDFADWALYPQHRKCGSSLLTGPGAAQHLLNGLSLRRKYRDTLFAPPFSSSAHLAVHSTLTSRTYQSALAFVYGLLPRFDISDVYVRAAQNVMFCRPSLVPAACCANLAKLRQEVDAAVRIPRAVDSAWQAAMLPLARIFGVKVNRLPGPSQLVDVLQGHACHDLSLPCGEKGRCVTPALLGKLWEVVDGAGKRSSQEAVFDRYCRTVMHSLLLEVLKSMQDVARNRSDTRVTLYSGHDLTMTPLLQTLGLYEGKWPNYATRVVLELYRKRSAPRQHFLRVLHNGRDVTSRVRFCQGAMVQGKLCPLKRFERFVMQENMETIGVRDAQGMKDFCRSKILY